MAFRGRGGGGGRWRGRGYGGCSNGFGYAKQEPYDLFPENVELPDVKGVIEEKGLVAENYRLQNFWIASPFYLEENTSKRPQSKGMDIERFSNRIKKKNSLKRDNLTQILLLTPQNFPQELIEGKAKKQKKGSVESRVRYTEIRLEKLDMLEKLEQKHEGVDEKDGVKRKGEDEEEEEEEDEDGEDGEAQEDFSDDDYYQNEHFDDDEDDYNAVDEGEDGPMY